MTFIPEYPPSDPKQLYIWAFRELSRLSGYLEEKFADAWDDLKFPASGINPPGQASDPDLDTTNGTWLFAASGTEVIFLIAQMPHAWKAGSEVKPHVHWYKTTSASGDVMWQLEYKKIAIGETMDASFTAVTSSTSAITDNDTAEEHLLTPFSAIDMSDMGISDMLVMKLSRLGSDAADTYGADAALLEFDIHYQIDARGSAREYIKSL